MALPSYLTTAREELERRAHQGCQALALGDGSVLCRVLDRYLMYADASDLTVMPHLCMNGYWEAWITLAIARLVRPGWHCVDVGANHGYYSLVMADGAGQAGRVLAVEPNPALAGLLERSVEVNGFGGQTAVLRRAVSDVAGLTVTLAVPQQRPGLATICREAGPLDSAVEVQTTTLDHELAEWPRVDLVKIDAEGMELAIWQGMSQTLARNKQLAVIMEFSAVRYPDPLGFLHAVQGAGYHICYVDYDGSIRATTAGQVADPRRIDWMLYLSRNR